MRIMGNKAIRIARNTGGSTPSIIPRAAGGRFCKKARKLKVSTILAMLAIEETKMTGTVQKSARAVAAPSERKWRAFLKMTCMPILAHTTSSGEISAYMGAMLNVVGCTTVCTAEWAAN